MSYCESCKSFHFGFIGYVGLLGYSILILFLGVLTEKVIYFSYEIIFIWVTIGIFAYGCLIVYSIILNRKLKVVNNK